MVSIRRKPRGREKWSAERESSWRSFFKERGVGMSAGEEL